MPPWSKDFPKFFLSFYNFVRWIDCDKILPQMVDLWHILHSDWLPFKNFYQYFKHTYMLQRRRTGFRTDAAKAGAGDLEDFIALHFPDHAT